VRESSNTNSCMPAASKRFILSEQSLCSARSTVDGRLDAAWTGKGLLAHPLPTNINRPDACKRSGGNRPTERTCVQGKPNFKMVGPSIEQQHPCKLS